MDISENLAVVFLHFKKNIWIVLYSSQSIVFPTTILFHTSKDTNALP